jgi:uncharacterized membrane protein YcjF (UPF0283 family)
MSFPEFGVRPVPQPKRSLAGVEGELDETGHQAVVEGHRESPGSLGGGVDPISGALSSRSDLAEEQPGTVTPNESGVQSESQPGRREKTTNPSPVDPEPACPLRDAGASDPSETHFIPTCGRPNRRPQLSQPERLNEPDVRSGEPHPPFAAGNRGLEGDSVDEVPSETSERSFISLGRRVLGPVVVAAFLGIGGLLALYIYCQLLAVLSTLAALPLWMAVPALILLSLLVALVVLAFGRLAVAYFRLRRNRQVRMRDLASLAQRAKLRKIAQARHKEAKQILAEYVETYPLPKPAASRRLDDPGAEVRQPSHASTLAGILSEQQLIDLHRAQRRLLSPAHYEDLNKWLDEYDRSFQAVLDEAAENRVSQCAKWVGWKTAISPSSLVDVLVATYWAFVLLRDLCLIYNVRVGSLGTAALLGQVFFNAYVAGRLEEYEKHAEETFHSAIGEFLPAFGQKIVAKFAAKTSIGLANYLLITRLGKHATRVLQPLART